MREKSSNLDNGTADRHHDICHNLLSRFNQNYKGITYLPHPLLRALIGHVCDNQFLPLLSSHDELSFPAGRPSFPRYDTFECVGACVWLKLVSRNSTQQSFPWFLPCFCSSHSHSAGWLQRALSRKVNSLMKSSGLKAVLLLLSQASPSMMVCLYFREVISEVINAGCHISNQSVHVVRTSRLIKLGHV